MSNTKIESAAKASAVAGLGTRLATRRAASEAQVPDKKGLKEVAERVGLLEAQADSDRLP